MRRGRKITLGSPDIGPGDRLILIRPYTVWSFATGDRRELGLRRYERVEIVGIDSGPPYGLLRVQLIDRDGEVVKLPWTSIEKGPIWVLHA